MQFQSLQKFLLVFLLILCVLGIFPQSTNAQESPTLYQRLGGVNAIAAVVDDFVERLLTNAVVTKNENVLASLQRITKAGLKFHLTGFVCEATGGPEKYSGRSMKDSHTHLSISEAEWQATVQELKTSLAKFSVPENEQNELLAIVGTTKPDIVTATSPAPVPIPEVEDTALPTSTSPPAKLVPEVDTSPSLEAPIPDPIDPEAQAAPPAEPETEIEGAQAAPPLEPDNPQRAQVAPPPEPGSDPETAQVAPPPPEPGTDTQDFHITPPAKAFPTPESDTGSLYDKFLDDDLYEFDELED